MQSTVTIVYRSPGYYPSEDIYSLMKSHTLRGSLVAIVTPMDEEGALAIDDYETLIDWHVEAGTRGLVVAGTTGESPTLSLAEIEKLVKVAVKRVDSRIPVLAGSGTHSTSATVNRSAALEKAGADACLVVTPYYNKPSQRGLFEHFSAVADAVSIPIMLYNVPGRTCCDLLPETTARLAKIDNIVGIKEATPGAERVTELRKRCGPDFVILSGDDATCLEAMRAGADGVISVTADAAPELMSKLCAKALGGDFVGAGEIDKKISALHRDLFVEANPIPIKWALEQMGMIQGGLRLPLTPLAAEFHAKVAAAMDQAGIKRSRA